MVPFMDRFPALAAAETRNVTLTGDWELPDGDYGFFELYCNERGCDCRRVVVQVLRPATGWSKAWATIGYGWESNEYYRKRLGAMDSNEDLRGPELDPLNEQSSCAPALLRLFRGLVLSPEYVERLKRHYQMFRETVDDAGEPVDLAKARRQENRKKKLRDPRRRRR
jgi:hypothetical protein